MPTFEALRDDYATDWKRMIIRDNRRAAVDAIARKLIGSRPRYQAVEKATGVPWFVIAVLHERESDADFTTHLHNGDPLLRRTYHVPAGRPPPPARPPFTWEESATDALTYDGLAAVKEWPVERIAYQCEAYNGWGYHRGMPSPYLWSFSNIYRSGKYVGDGVFSASAVDKQCGVMPMLYAMAMLDQSVMLVGAGLRGTPKTKNVFGDPGPARTPASPSAPPAKPPPPVPPPRPTAKVIPIRPPSRWAFLWSLLKRRT
jgi:lysozyme family protein